MIEMVDTPVTSILTSNAALITKNAEEGL